jgi:predicted nucleic acid-binding protein
VTSQAYSMAGKYIYWDAMCFIYRIARNVNFISVLEEVTRLAEKGDIVLVTSVFSMAEVARVDGVPDAAEQERLIMDFFDNEFIYPVAFDEKVCKLSRGIVRTCKLKGKDAVHVATALLVPGISSMHSYDTKVLQCMKHLTGFNLTIEKPDQWLTALNNGQEAFDMAERK